MIRWPFVWLSTYDRLRTDRGCILDALREANSELRRHRQLIAALKDGDTRTILLLEKAIAAARRS